MFVINEHYKEIVISNKKLILLPNLLQNRYPGEEICVSMVVI